MFFIRLTLALFILGILVWIAGAIVVRQKKKQSVPARIRRYEQMIRHLGITAKTIFLLAGISFVIGFMVINGSYAE